MFRQWSEVIAAAQPLNESSTRAWAAARDTFVLCGHTISGTREREMGVSPRHLRAPGQFPSCGRELTEVVKDLVDGGMVAHLDGARVRHVVERGADPLEGQPRDLMPGEPVHR